MNDKDLATEVEWTVELIGVACAAIRESGQRQSIYASILYPGEKERARPSSAVSVHQAASVVDEALEVMQANVVAFRRGKPLPPNDLRSAWSILEVERWTGQRAADPSSSAFLRTLSLRSSKIGRQRRTQEVRSLLQKPLGGLSKRE